MIPIAAAKTTRTLYRHKTKILVVLLAFFVWMFFRKSSAKENPKSPSDFVPESNTLYNPNQHPRPYQHYTQMVLNIHQALKGWGTDTEVLEGIFYDINPYELQLIDNIWTKTYDETLATWLRDDLGLFNGDLEAHIQALYNEAGLQY